MLSPLNDHLGWTLSSMSKDTKITALAAAALVLSSLSLGGCATSTGSSLMDARAEAAAPPRTSNYPAVEDLPLQREQPAMTADERLKLQKELIGARDRLASRARAKQGATSPQPVKP
jgi:hypothetical protein